MLSSLIESGTTIQPKELLICIATSLVLGLLVATIHMQRNVYTKSFVVTVAVLPILVQSVIMLVNGNLGTGLAVVGAFSLIRFRSVAGGSREITSIFWSMGIGIATGMGYVAYVVIFSVIVALFLLLLYLSPFGNQNKVAERELKVTIPEDLDYPELFTDIFEEYTYTHHLNSVRTTTMGSLYELRYILLLKDHQQEKEIIDQIRVRNGNLPVVLGKVATNREEL
ncbi:DUF4956 domain-containing protein [Enterococcus sp. AZ084]|uniref:DUF4956 domain-containing protein n=1 Tax=Enterococcus sp. AZ084 TaxID=2774671 RepID=UPI003F244019